MYNSKELVDERALPYQIFFNSLNLAFPDHIHGFVSSQCSSRCVEKLNSYLFLSIVLWLAGLAQEYYSSTSFAIVLLSLSLSQSTRPQLCSSPFGKGSLRRQVEQSIESYR